MKYEYEQMLRLIESQLKSKGFFLKNNEDYTSFLENKDGWKVVFVGDRYDRPAFNLLIQTPHQIANEKYLVSLLMITLDNAKEGDFTLPKMVEFIINKHNELFDVRIPYRQSYQRIHNRISEDIL